MEIQLTIDAKATRETQPDAPELVLDQQAIQRYLTDLGPLIDQANARWAKSRAIAALQGKECWAHAGITFLPKPSDYFTSSQSENEKRCVTAALDEAAVTLEAAGFTDVSFGQSGYELYWHIVPENSNGKFFPSRSKG